MKKIWLISYSLDGVMAGPSIRFQRYAPLFIDRGYRLVFVTYRLNKSFLKYEEREFFDIRRIDVKIKRLSRTRFITKALILILLKGGSGSTIFSFGLQTYQLWMLPLIKIFKCHLFYINTMAISNKFFHSENFLSKKWNATHTWLYKIMFNKINGVIVSTQSLADYFKPFALESDKSIIINNGVDTNKFRPIDENAKIKLRELKGFKQTDLLLLFVGLKTERKGIKELVEAWLKVNHLNTNAKLLLVGDEKQVANQPEFIQWWDEFKKLENERKNRVVILPGSPDINYYFQIADAFVFPSKKEGMPNVVLEAMSAGLPLIMNKFEGYSKDYGIPGKTHLLINLSNPTELTDALTTLISEPEIAKKMGTQARIHALDFFSVKNSVDKYISLVQ